MKSKGWGFALFLLLAACCRLALMQTGDIWHAEAVWLLRPAGDLTGSPLFCLLIQAWSLVSRDELWLRVLSFAISLASAAVLFFLARKAFSGLGLMETAILAAVSPLLCSAAWEVHPCSLEVLAAALWLLAFLKLMERGGGARSALHAAAAFLSVAANPLTALFVPVQAVVLLLYHRGDKAAVLRWLMTVAAAGAALAILAVLITGPGQEMAAELASPRDTLSAYDAGVLLTDVALGRLHSWRPLTPVITMVPPGFGDESIEGRRIGESGDGPLFTLLQGMQILFFSWFMAAVVLACLSVWRIKTWPLPFQVRSKALLQKVSDPGSEAAALLLLSVLAPVAASFFPAGGGDIPFPERRLLFIAAPVLVLVGRGFTRFQWKALRYALLAFFAVVSLVYSFTSTGLQQAADGISEAVHVVRQDWQEGDVLAADTFIRGPAVWYLQKDPEEALRVTAGSGRLWWIEFDPLGGAENDGVAAFMARAGLPPLDEADVTEEAVSESESTLLFRNYTVTPWLLR